MTISRLDDVAMDEIRLTTPVSDADIARLKLGDVVVGDRGGEPDLGHGDVVEPLDHSMPSRR